MYLSLKGEKKKRKEMESELHAGQKDSYLLEFSEVLLDLYGSRYASRIEMLYRLVKNWGKEQY